MRPEHRRILFAASSILLVAIFTFCLLSIAPSGPGTQDFIEYWSAYQLFSHGKDPYDPRLMLEIQQSVRSQATPLMMWNPPWALFFLLPALVQPFDDAARIWFSLNASLFFVTVLLLHEVSGSKLGVTRLLLLTSFLILPIGETLALGQISLVTTTGVAALYLGLCRKDDRLIGLGLIPMTIKPHVFYLIAVAFLWWAIRFREYRWAAYFVMGFGALLIWCLATSPNSLHYWVDSVAHNRTGSVQLFEWAVATLVGATRASIAALTGDFPLWPIAVIPGATSIVVLCTLIRKANTFSWKTTFPPLLAISCFTSPYGWIFDFSCLVITFAAASVFVLESPNRSHRVLFFTVAAACFACTTLAYGRIFHSHHELFFFPLMVLLFWIWAYRLRHGVAT